MNNRGQMFAGIRADANRASRRRDRGQGDLIGRDVRSAADVNQFASFDETHSLPRVAYGLLILPFRQCRCRGRDVVLGQLGTGFNQVYYAADNKDVCAGQVRRQCLPDGIRRIARAKNWSQYATTTVESNEPCRRRVDIDLDPRLVAPLFKEFDAEEAILPPNEGRSAAPRPVLASGSVP